MNSLPTTRFARIGAGIAANGVMQTVQLVVRLAEVPILLKCWGAIGYGEWLLVAALPTALSISDGGFTKTAQREMTMRAGRADAKGVEGVFQSTWLMLLSLSTIVLVLLALVLPQLPLVRLAKLTTVDAASLGITIVMLAAQVLVYFQCGLLLGGFTSVGKYALGVLFIAFSSLACFVGAMTGALLGFGMPGAAVGSFVGQCIGYATMFVVFKWAVPSISYGVSAASITEIRALWTPSIANLAFPVTDALNMQGVRLVVGLSLGPVALAVFSTTRTLCRLALQPVLSIARTVEPELSLAYGGGQSEQARRLFLQSSHAGFWMSAALSLVIAVAGPFLYRIWTNQQLDLDLLALCFMLIASVLSVLWGIALTVPCSINAHTSLSFPFLGIYGVGSILLVFIFAKQNMGASGAAIGVLIGDALALILVSIFALRIVGTNPGEWVISLIKSPVVLFRIVLVRLQLVLKQVVVR